MIEILLEILSLDDFHGITEEIEIAKGKNKLCTNWKDAWRQAKRKKVWQRQ